MRYQASDYPLFVLSLLLTALLIAPILPNRFTQGLLVCALIYLGWFFVVRHGAKFESSVFAVVWEGLKEFPGYLLRSWWHVRSIIVPTILIFALAVSAEHALRPLLIDTMWLDSAPWGWVIWTPFVAITCFRAFILVAHLLRASHVRDFMESSPLKKTVAVSSIHNHIVHAFVTGMLSHLSLVATTAWFYLLTDPSYLREALLLVGFLTWRLIASRLRKRKILENGGTITHSLFYKNHATAHHSRFFFTVFHGHHHDALPSALIGSAGGTGFLENTDRAFIWLDPLYSMILLHYALAVDIVIDMVVHQYIPGVFPFVKVTVKASAHHAFHHFGSLRPLGMIFDGYAEPQDFKNGYKPDSVLTRWFLEQAARYEGPVSDESRASFLTIGTGSA